MTAQVLELRPTLAGALREARRLLNSKGWAGPMTPWRCCLDAAGQPVNSDDPKLAHYSIEGAIRKACRNDHALILSAWSELGRAVAPMWWELDRALLGLPPHTEQTRPLWKRALELMKAKKGPEIDEWLADPERQIGDVLKAFDRAINRLRGQTDG